MSLAEVARVTTYVEVSPLDAFEVFTQEVNYFTVPVAFDSTLSVDTGSA